MYARKAILVGARLHPVVDLYACVLVVLLIHQISLPELCRAFASITVVTEINIDQCVTRCSSTATFVDVFLILVFNVF